MKSKALRIPIIEKLNNIADAHNSDIRLWLSPAVIATGISLLANLMPKIEASKSPTIAAASDLVKRGSTALLEATKSGKANDAFDHTLNKVEDAIGMIEEDFDAIEDYDYAIPVSLDHLDGTSIYSIDNDLPTSLAAQLPLIGAPVSILTSFAELATKGIAKLFGKKKKKNKKKKAKRLAELHRKRRELEAKQGSISDNDEVAALVNEISTLETDLNTDDDAANTYESDGTITFDSNIDINTDDYDIIGDLIVPIDYDAWYTYLNPMANYRRMASVLQKDTLTLDDVKLLTLPPYSIPVDELIALIDASNKNNELPPHATKYYSRLSELLFKILDTKFNPALARISNEQATMVKRQQEVAAKEQAAANVNLISGTERLRELGINVDCDIDTDLSPEESQNIQALNREMAQKRRIDLHLLNLIKKLYEVAPVSLHTFYSSILAEISKDEHQAKSLVLVPIKTANRSSRSSRSRVSRYRQQRVTGI
jgi:hypothetical protein